jgi:HlyD family secretion protein
MFTEIISGIAPGTEVLTDFSIQGGGEEEQGQQAQNPFMPRPRGNNRQNNQQKK